MNSHQLQAAIFLLFFPVKILIAYVARDACSWKFKLIHIRKGYNNGVLLLNIQFMLMLLVFEVLVVLTCT